MIKHLELTGTSSVSDIYVGHGLLDRAAEYCARVFSPSRIHIVTDTNVAPLYLARLEDQFEIPVSFSEIPAGEEHKSLFYVQKLYDDFIAAGITRADLIIALGGGVTGDMAGFAAATFLRGTPLCQIPTTLLAQVDSSVGGKTGVDLPAGKNLVGAFYQPRLVLIDPDVLSSLPQTVFSDGMAEVIKYGYIKNPQILDMVEKEDFRASIADIIYECVKIKRDIVAVDEHDTGLRMILNFGHTIGHAAEKLGNYVDLTHGQAVAIGMACALRLAELTGTSEASSEELINILAARGLPTSLDYPREAVFEALLSDKKKFADTVNFIFVRRKGEAVIEKLSTRELRELLMKL